MLLPVTVPAGLPAVLRSVRSCFTAPAFATFTALLLGMLCCEGPCTVTGMWTAAGLAGRAHWARAHRFSAQTRWDAGQLGLALAAAVVAVFVPDGGALTVAVDDTLFRRVGRKVFGRTGSMTGPPRAPSRSGGATASWSRRWW